MRDLFRKYTAKEMEDGIVRLRENMEKLKNKIIPEQYPDIVDSFQIMDIKIFELGIYRSAFIDEAGYPLVAMNWIKILYKLLKNHRVMEIMAGSGIITKALQNCGCDIFATDNFSFGLWDIWCEIENIDCVEAVEKYGKNLDYILVSWPEMNNTIYNVLRTMRKVNPNLSLIYIGEFGGCCADKNFTESAKIIKNDIIDECNKYFLSWSCIYDRIFLIK